MIGRCLFRPNKEAQRSTHTVQAVECSVYVKWGHMMDDNALVSRTLFPDAIRDARVFALASLSACGCSCLMP